MGSHSITDLLDPVAAQDAATKNYVDLVNTSMQAYVDANPPIHSTTVCYQISQAMVIRNISLLTGTRAFTGKQSLGGYNLTDLLDPLALSGCSNEIICGCNSDIQCFVLDGNEFIIRRILPVHITLHTMVTLLKPHVYFLNFLILQHRRYRAFWVRQYLQGSCWSGCNNRKPPRCNLYA